MHSQSTSSILMIRPVQFGFNEETAQSNVFQNKNVAEQTKVTAQHDALQEFDAMVSQLRAAGINILVIDDTLEPHTPDSIFPNNWVSFHNSGTVVLYPMLAENRRLERRNDILESLKANYYINRLVDLTSFELENKFLEGTGSMVLDRKFKIAYTCLSSRTNTEVLTEFGSQMNYEIVFFHATDANNTPIYHTNVLMCIGDLFAVICLQAIPDPEERHLVRNSLESSGRQIIEITFEQLQHFAGNMLQVKNEKGQKFIIMSTQAYESLTEKQRSTLSEFGILLHCDLATIEANGGGSARCMMAEIHLPKK